MIPLIMTFLTIMSSKFWFLCWVMLEVSSFFFIPFFFVKDNSNLSKFVMWKYYMIQFVGSSIFLFSFLIFNSGLLSSMTLLSVNFTMLISIMIKVGLPPFHSWMFEISENMNWLKFILLNTIQKINPLFFLWNMNYESYFKEMICIISVIWTFNSLFDYSVRRFFVYSSILNISWMMYSTFISLWSFYLFILIYIINMMGVMLTMQEKNESKFSNLLFMKYNSWFSLSFFFVNMASLMGVPPFMGFILKFNMLTTIYSSLCTHFSAFMLFTMSIVMMFMYMYMWVPFFFSKNKVFIKKTPNHYLLINIHIVIIQFVILMFYFV